VNSNYSIRFSGCWQAGTCPIARLMDSTSFTNSLDLVGEMSGICQMNCIKKQLSRLSHTSTENDPLGIERHDQPMDGKSEVGPQFFRSFASRSTTSCANRSMLPMNGAPGRFTFQPEQTS
jgi:hypothetical protein